MRTKPHISFFHEGDSSFVRVDVSHVPCGAHAVVEGPISKKRGLRRFRAVQHAFSRAVYMAHLAGWNALTGQSLPTVPWDWSRGRPGQYPSEYQQYKERRLAEIAAAHVQEEPQDTK